MSGIYYTATNGTWLRTEHLVMLDRTIIAQCASGKDARELATSLNAARQKDQTSE